MVTCTVYAILLIWCLPGAKSGDASFSSLGNSNGINNETIDDVFFKTNQFYPIKTQPSLDPILTKKQKFSVKQDGVWLPDDVIEARSRITSARNSFHEVTATEDGPHLTGAASPRNKPFKKWKFGESERSGANINGLTARHQSKWRRFDTDGSDPIVTDMARVRGKAGENRARPKQDFYKSRNDALRNKRATLFDGRSRTEIDNERQSGDVLQDEDSSSKGQKYSVVAFKGSQINVPGLDGVDGGKNSLKRGVKFGVPDKLSIDSMDSAGRRSRTNSEKYFYQGSISERNVTRNEGRRGEMESQNKLTQKEMNGVQSVIYASTKALPSYLQRRRKRHLSLNEYLESQMAGSRGDGGYRDGQLIGENRGGITGRVQNDKAEWDAHFRYDLIKPWLNGSDNGTSTAKRVLNKLKQHVIFRTLATTRRSELRQDGRRYARERSFFDIKRKEVNNENDRRGKVMRSDGQPRGLKSNPALGGDRGVKRARNRRRGVKLKGKHVPGEVTHDWGTFRVVESRREIISDGEPERNALIWRKRRILEVHSNEDGGDYGREIEGDEAGRGEGRSERDAIKPVDGMLGVEAIETDDVTVNKAGEPGAEDITRILMEHYMVTSETMSEEKIRGTHVPDGESVSNIEMPDRDVGNDRRTSGETVYYPESGRATHSVDGVNKPLSRVATEVTNQLSEVDILKMEDVGYVYRNNAAPKVAEGEKKFLSQDQIAISQGDHHEKQLTKDNVIGERPGSRTVLWERNGSRRNERSGDTVPERGNDGGIRGDNVQSDKVGSGGEGVDAHDLDIKKLSQLVNGGYRYSQRDGPDQGRGPESLTSDGKDETMKFISEHSVAELDSRVFDDVIGWISSIVSEKSNTETGESFDLPRITDSRNPDSLNRKEEMDDDLFDESTTQDGLHEKSQPIGSTFGYLPPKTNEDEDNNEPYGTVTSVYSTFRGLRDIDESDRNYAQGFSSYEELFHTDHNHLNTVMTPDTVTEHPQGDDTTILGSSFGEKQSISSTSRPWDDEGAFDYVYNLADTEEYKYEDANFIKSMRGFDYEYEPIHHRSKHSVSDPPSISLTTPEQPMSPKSWQPSPTTPQATATSGIVSFESKRLVLTRVNEPNLDVTYIQYVPESEVEFAMANPKPLWANDVFDSNGNPIVKIGVILPGKASILFSLNKSRSSIELASEKIIGPEGSLPGYKVQIVFRDSQCSETFGPLNGIDLYVRRLAYVFIGPSCDFATAPLARFTYYWGKGVPIMTAGSLVGAFADKQEYRLLTRIQGGYTMTAEFMRRVVESFEWSTFGFVFHDVKFGYKTSTSECLRLMDRVYTVLQRRFRKDLWFLNFNENEMNETMYEMLLEKVRVKTRIVVMCASPHTVREIMIKAHELNFDNGEYVFFNIDLFSSKNASETPWYRPDDTEERNKKARKAYESLMTVTLRMPTSTEYRHFSNEVKARALEMFPNFTYGEDEVNSFVGAFHDAVLLYALALNETLAENGSISDGDTITKKMWNRTFAGITGNVSIDANGDRNADYSLLDLNPETNKFEVVANYFGNKRKYEPVPNKTIHWAGGRLGPPPDTPTCGFDGSKCPPDEPFPEYGIVIIVLGSILLIVLIAVFFIYRHIKLEAELAEMNWRVRWDDILFGAPEKNKKLERQGSRLSLRKGSLPSDCSGDTIAVHLNDASNRQLFTRTGYYKGAIIAIKPIHRSNITINKPMLLEIKRMKDLQNDHIVRFIGACICFPNSCILTEYCPKGSLQDVLENEQIKLDWMFRYSIMQDIVRGMAYLQGTEIRSHGYLKSTNCVVDSRFVVKITDFGLHHLRGAVRSSEEDENSYSYFHNKLWTAPELLRMAYRPPEGTIKGDVYSFAIICQEIVYRNGVFYLQNMDLSPQEISQKVKLGLKPYFRPTLEEYDCPCDELAGVIKRCWAEDPADRPDFQALKSIIRKLNRDGDKGNILDNLLSRMEQYANNLEALVEERTADYLQQKKKAEDLLYNMLPKKVASQLIRGESVTAEWYDSVSIYFSDICGFTAMSAESTPMEVVDLLNDLYTTFDSIIENFDVYKVETIGDAYMVVSGLPDRNGILHAREIARMSLALLKATVTFRIRHRPKDRLKIRIGIHTGSVCAGVVGLKMPRYCLFGDTVNTASRMESNGLPLKIHVSPQCKEVLDTFGSFDLELRGNVEMKGKGSVKTYWLLGEKTTSDSPGVSLNIL